MFDPSVRVSHLMVEVWLCHHCEGTNVNVAGTKHCGQCGEQVFRYERRGRERVN